MLYHVRLVGCLFHYTQARYRQIQALGLRQSYQTYVGTKSLMRCYKALPVLPAPHIQPGIVATSLHVFSPFINYIREQWIEGNIFTVTDLSIFGMETRTNNDVRDIITASTQMLSEVNNPLPTWLLKECIAELVPTITAVVNMSLRDSLMPKSLKTALIRPLLKTTGLDSDILKKLSPHIKFNMYLESHSSHSGGIREAH